MPLHKAPNSAVSRGGALFLLPGQPVNGPGAPTELGMQDRDRWVPAADGALLAGLAP